MKSFILIKVIFLMKKIFHMPFTPYIRSIIDIVQLDYLILIK